MANAHKDSENKFLPPVRGRLFERLPRKNVLKNVLRAHTLSKTTRNVKSSEMWDCSSVVLQWSCIIPKAITLIHPTPPPPGSSRRPPKPPKQNERMSLLRRTVPKSRHVNPLKTGKAKGNTELRLDNIKRHFVTGDENKQRAIDGFESVECGR